MFSLAFNHRLWIDFYRVEALPQLSLALTLGATLVAFDFAGSGKSGGEHVSLGYYERDDLQVCTWVKQNRGHEKGRMARCAAQVSK